jgi:hypothetical protein
MSHNGVQDFARARYRGRVSIHQRLLVGIVLSVILAFPGAGDALADPSPRVRPLTPRMRALLARGAERSPTVAALLDGLARSNLIVHIEERWPRGGESPGATRFVEYAGGQRYLRITLDARVRGPEAVALLGHELQHAWEVAQAPWVVDVETFDRLYRAIGHPSCQGRRRARYDTAAARHVSRAVYAEMVRGD